jgi:catechol 2,3-dioxygenase-like lactoylglutathione lyase family enzyme
MIFGTHVLFYSTDPEADRTFLRDVLGLPGVDAGGGWLIFALPPAEAGVHPSDGKFAHEHAGRQVLGAIVYLMCDDLHAEMRALAGKGVQCGKIEKAEWGVSTSIPLPSGASLGLYQPTHLTALHLTAPYKK